MPKLGLSKDAHIQLAFLAVLITILLLVKLGGGTNMAIITPLLTILGGIANNFRKSAPRGSADSASGE